MSEPSLLQRMKERKLVQWALAYLTGAFAMSIRWTADATYDEIAIFRFEA
jgi:hypothetical protein